jgi:hypothetical protein
MGPRTINGRRYYYRSERQGSRVRTIYCGTGEFGSLMAKTDEILRAEREAERNERQADREEVDAEERAVAEWFDGIQAVSDAAMVTVGFHKHKREWRRERR